MVDKPGKVADSRSSKWLVDRRRSVALAASRHILDERSLATIQIHGLAYQIVCRAYGPPAGRRTVEWGKSSPHACMLMASGRQPASLLVLHQI